MWWPAGRRRLARGARVGRSARSGTAWAVAGGEQGGAHNVETYVLVTNTSPFDGRVRVTLLPESGNPVVRDVDVAANSRTTVWMGGTSATTPSRRSAASPTALGSASSSRASPASAGTPRIVVERAMYSDAPGEHWAAGSDVLGTRLR